MTYPHVQLMINNEWRTARGEATLKVYNPADGSVIGSVAKATIADLDDALAATAKGFETWRNTPAIERCKTMRNAANLLRERAEAIARLMTLEQGKPLAEAKGEVLSACDVIEFFAEESRRIYGRIVPPRSMAVQQMILKDPVGPVAAFTPWNFPINQIVRKLSAALAAGCSMIVKAPEETPASPAELIRAFVDAGLPAGVVGLVYGDPAEISNYLIPHPTIRKVTFTGSTPVGKQLAALAGKHMKRTTMELGGHAPVIVAADADIAHAVKMIAGAKFRNAGQVCISPTRFLVEQGAREEFVAGFLKYVQTLKVGSGLVSWQGHSQRVVRRHGVRDARGLGGTQHLLRGLTAQPHVAVVQRSMRTAQQEVQILVVTGMHFQFHSRIVQEAAPERVRSVAPAPRRPALTRWSSRPS